jgi:RNA polymerase sigma factor (sigma-70 family)
MLGIARHKVQDHYRRVLKNVQFPDESENWPSSEAPLEALLVSAQAKEWIGEVLAILPEDYRTVLLWRYWEKRSAEDIGDAIGRSPKAVERLLSRAREKFKQEWQRKEAGQ